MEQRIALRGDVGNLPTKSEMLVLLYVTDGLTSKEIATRTGKSVKTIETQRASAMRRLEIHNTAQIVRWVMTHTARPETEISKIANLRTLLLKWRDHTKEASRILKSEDNNELGAVYHRGASEAFDRVLGELA